MEQRHVPGQPSSSQASRLLHDLAEIGLEARSRGEFRRASLERICRAVSMDAASANHTSTGAAISVDTWGLDVAPLRPSLLGYMNEISVEELCRAARGATTVDDLVFASHRRVSLRVYTEYLVPMNVFGFCTHMWMNRHGCFWVTFSREGRRARYRAHDLSTLDAVMPILAVGEVLHAQPTTGDDRSSARRAFTREHRVTDAEHQVVELVARGLTNAEIGAILGRSNHTVRNQLAAAFCKLRVSRRAELVTVLATLHEGARPITDGEPGSLRRLLRSRSPSCQSD